tara:strand:- start:178 stop:984 length:807 start_codon:yes stop_codon:yes gene_type:complete
MGFIDIILRNAGELWFKSELKYRQALEKASPSTRKLMESIMDDTNNEGRFELNCWLSQMGAKTHESNRQIGFILERNDISEKDRAYWIMQREANNRNRKTWRDLRDLVVYIQFEVDELASWDRPDDTWGERSVRTCPKDPKRPSALSGYAQGLGEAITAAAIIVLVIKVLAVVTVTYLALKFVETILDGLSALNGVDTPEQTIAKSRAFLACLQSGGKAVGPEKCQKILEKTGLGKTKAPLISGNTLIFIGLGIFVYAKYIMPAMKDK